MAENKINQLVRSLLQKDSIEDCSLQELEHFAGRHPYFGAAQLLLAKKMQEENSPGFEEQMQKTLLFFHNPLWVQKLMGANGSAELRPGRGVAVEEKIPVPVPAPRQDGADGIAAESAGSLQTEESRAPQGEIPASIEKSAATEAADAGQEDRISIPPPREETHTDLSFEPYHTVDYFASQGINWKAEDRPDDTLGRQLKSFTDWLRSMKRLPAAEISKTPESGSEKKVAELAEHSLQEDDVVTEAMAEVWIKQGRPEKAREIYRKLSLSEPSKSAYFAAKIEELK